MQLSARFLVALESFAAAWLVACSAQPEAMPDSTRIFDNPQRVTLRGYDGDAMEAFVTRDGRYLLFNNRNDPSVDTNLHYPERIDDLTFQYRGEIAGVNTHALEGVATVDRDNVLYFVSTRSYATSRSTIYRGNDSHGQVTGVEPVPGISKHEPGTVDFDVEISPDGRTLYFAEDKFSGASPKTADIVIASKRGNAFERAGCTESILRRVNTDALEYAPCISADGLTLFFTRARIGFGGGTAIYMSRRSSSSGPFDAPARLAAIEGLAEAPALSPDERSLYHHKKDGPKYAIYRLVRQ